ncbi:MAG: hypothetical protein JWO24_1274 [Rhodospirillales bacterium]|jgi:hypothetical protein|nr:hypothetical protein [Rhodospirillales bacterium]
MPIRGIATGGWPGRSFSCGVADAVTVPAGRAADADAAATIIANAVDAAHRGIQHAPACSLDPDSDLSDILVTTGVDPLPVAVVEGALNAGVRVAEALREGGLIFAALLFCQERAGLRRCRARPDGNRWRSNSCCIAPAARVAGYKTGVAPHEEIWGDIVDVPGIQERRPKVTMVVGAAAATARARKAPRRVKR